MLTLLFLFICCPPQQALERLSSDVQKQFIYKYLTLNETNQLREISNSMKHQINSEFPHRSALYALSKWIATIKTTQNIHSHVYFKCERLGLRYNTPAVDNYTVDDIHLIEKVFLAIAMNDALQSSADGLCIIIATMLGINIDDYVTLRTMQSSMLLSTEDTMTRFCDTIRVCAHSDLNVLYKLFVFAEHEMVTNRCKYNRYTCFALNFAHSIIRRYSKCACFDAIRQKLWDHVPHECIIDYARENALMFENNREIPQRIKYFITVNVLQSKNVSWLLLYPLSDAIKKCDAILLSAAKLDQCGDILPNTLDMMLVNGLVNESQLIQRLWFLHEKGNHPMLLEGLQYVLDNTTNKSGIETEEVSNLRTPFSTEKHISDNSSQTCCDVM